MVNFKREVHMLVEIAKPSAMMTILNDPQLVELAKEADQQLHRALESL